MFAWLLQIYAGCDEYDPCAEVKYGSECQELADCSYITDCWCGYCIPKECTGVLDFSSYFLVDSIRRAIDKPNGDIRYEDVRHLEELHGFCQESAYCVESLDGIQCLTSLKELYLVGQFIGDEDIEILQRLPCLETLALSSNDNLSDISPLAEITTLTKLLIAGCKITDIEPLAGLNNLTVLDISDNVQRVYENGTTILRRITDLTPLSELTSLKELNISWSHPVDGLFQLSDLKQMSELTAEYSTIEDLGPLRGLTSLEALNLKHNNISDLGPLLGNTGVGNGDRVTLLSNPIDCDVQASNMQVLKDRGVILETDCP